MRREPFMEAEWDALPPDEKHRRMRAFHHDRLVDSLNSAGLSLLDGFQPGAIEWCTGCDSEPERGRDSYGDCADCGEDLVWVMEQ